MTFNIETERLLISEISVDDADFVNNLLNQPSFIKYIGDRNVRNAVEARGYIESKFLESYRRFGFGMYLVELKKDQIPIGICGFVKRDALPDADIGFAFLPEHCSQGYAVESAAAMMNHGKTVLGFKRILAITTKDNVSSAKLLRKIGFEFEKVLKLSDDDDEVKLFSYNV